MKKVFMVLFVIAIVMSIGTIVQAATYQQEDVTASFFVVDKSGDGSVMLMVLNSTADEVEYSTNQIDWYSLNSLEFVPFRMEQSEGQQLVYWRHDDGDGTDYTADLLFSGSGGDDLWDSVTIFWDGMDVVQPINGYPPSTTITFGMPMSSDRVAPVPIPACALLLGSGIVGLITFGRVRMRRSP